MNNEIDEYKDIIKSLQSYIYKIKKNSNSKSLKSSSKLYKKNLKMVNKKVDLQVISIPYMKDYLSKLTPYKKGYKSKNNQPNKSLWYRADNNEFLAHKKKKKNQLFPNIKVNKKIITLKPNISSAIYPVVEVTEKRNKLKKIKRKIIQPRKKK